MVLKRDDLEQYREREHAKAKHALLSRYVTRYAMILGNAAPSLCFVDAFAGPWKSADANLSDTSFGLSVATLKECAESLYARFKRRPKIRALWIEEDPTAFAKLKEFARHSRSSRIEIETLNGRFENLIPDVERFVGDEAYGFVFIDPKGYKGLIEPAVLAPLLMKPRVEVLVNYMWSHIKYALGLPDAPGHSANMRRLFGADTSRLMSLSGETLEVEAVSAYERRLREAAVMSTDRRLRVLSYAIRDTRGQRLPKYYLVHGTHDPVGLITFATECQQIDGTQAEIFVASQAMRREEKAGVADLFEPDSTLLSSEREANTAVWLKRLPEVGSELKVDAETWAMMLEESRCVPDCLQLGLKRLIDSGVLECPSCGKRRRHFVHFEKSETVRRVR